MTVTPTRGDGPAPPPTADDLWIALQWSEEFPGESEHAVFLTREVALEALAVDDAISCREAGQDAVWDSVEELPGGVVLWRVEGTRRVLRPAYLNVRADTEAELAAGGFDRHL